MDNVVDHMKTELEKINILMKTGHIVTATNVIKSLASDLDNWYDGENKTCYGIPLAKYMTNEQLGRR